jgi:hypothetical protein
MAQQKERPVRRIVRKAQPSSLPDRVKQSITLTRRTSGILSFVAKTRCRTESDVIEEALVKHFAGWRVGDPDDRAGEDEAAA